MARFPGFGDSGDLTTLKKYVEENQIMEGFTSEEQEHIKQMAKILEERSENSTDE